MIVLGINETHCATAAVIADGRVVGCASEERFTRLKNDAGYPRLAIDALLAELNIAHADIDVHPKERKADVIGQRAEERELFEELLDGHLVDVARALDPDNPGLFTWWPPWRNMRQRNIGWRIDYILASRTIAERATRCTVLADIGTSDHAPIMMTTV